MTFSFANYGESIQSNVTFSHDQEIGYYYQVQYPEEISNILFELETIIDNI